MNKGLITHGLDILIHITILFTILMLLFKFYGSYLIENNLTTSLKKEIDSALDKYNLKYIKCIPGVESILQRLDKIYKKESNLERKKWNKNIYDKGYIIIGFLIFTIIISYILVNMYCKDSKIDFKALFIDNILTFIGIGIVEFIFLTTIYTQYVAIKPSKLRKKIEHSIIKNLNVKE